MGLSLPNTKMGKIYSGGEMNKKNPITAEHRISVAFTNPMLEKLRNLARKKDRSISYLVRWALGKSFPSLLSGNNEDKPTSPPNP
jgi:hypothetical protein